MPYGTRTLKEPAIDRPLWSVDDTQAKIANGSNWHSADGSAF